MLQETQFEAEGNLASVENREIAISNVKLNAKNENELNNYEKSNLVHCNQQKLKKQKAVILDFVRPDHNSGKRMQHIIYNGFFFEKPSVKINIIKPSDMQITSLPIAHN